MKIRIILRQKKKRKLVVLIRKNGLWRLYCYAHFWRAYNTQFPRAYDTKFVGVHMIRIYTTTLTLPIA